MADAPEPPLSELLWTVAVARLILGPAMSIQVRRRAPDVPAWHRICLESVCASPNPLWLAGTPHVHEHFAICLHAACRELRLWRRSQHASGSNHSRSQRQWSCGRK